MVDWALKNNYLPSYLWRCLLPLHFLFIWLICKIVFWAVLSIMVPFFLFVCSGGFIQVFLFKFSFFSVFPSFGSMGEPVLTLQLNHFTLLSKKNMNQMINWLVLTCRLIGQQIKVNMKIGSQIKVKKQDDWLAEESQETGEIGFRQKKVDTPKESRRKWSSETRSLVGSTCGLR